MSQTYACHLMSLVSQMRRNWRPASVSHRTPNLVISTQINVSHADGTYKIGAADEDRTRLILIDNQAPSPEDYNSINWWTVRILKSRPY